MTKMRIFFPIMMGACIAAGIAQAAFFVTLRAQLEGAIGITGNATYLTREEGTFNGLFSVTIRVTDANDLIDDLENANIAVQVISALDGNVIKADCMAELQTFDETSATYKVRWHVNGSVESFSFGSCAGPFPDLLVTDNVKAYIVPDLDNEVVEGRLR